MRKSECAEQLNRHAAITKAKKKKKNIKKAKQQIDNCYLLLMTATPTAKSDAMLIRLANGGLTLDWATLVDNFQHGSKKGSTIPTTDARPTRYAFSIRSTANVVRL